MTTIVVQGITNAPLELLLEDRHIELPMPAVLSATPNERLTGQCIPNEGHEDEYRRIGQHGRPPADAQDLVDGEVQHCEEYYRREWGQDCTGEDEQ